MITNRYSVRPNRTRGPLIWAVLLTLSSLVVVHLTSSGMAAQTCTGGCISQGHYNLSAQSYPWAEDISSATSQPYGDPIYVTGPNFPTWTVLQSGCSLVNQQNLQSSTTFNVLFRAAVVIDTGTTAPAGTLYNVQLTIDGAQHGWYERRVSDVLPQTERFEGTAQHIPAGNHVYALQVSVIGSGTIEFSQQWLTALGAPSSSNPGDRSVRTDTISVGTGWAQITDAVTFTVSTPVDLVVQGYTQVNSVAGATQLTFVPNLSCCGWPARYGSVAVPSHLDNGINFHDHLLNLAPGTYTLYIVAHTNAGTATLQYRQVEFQTYPANVWPSSFVSAEVSASDTVTVDTSTTQAQPTAPIFDTSFGKWTKLLEMPMGPEFGGNDGMVQAYVQLLGNLSGTPLAEFGFQYNQPGGTDVGLSLFEVPAGPDGLYLFGDVYNLGCSSCTITLWMRKVYGNGLGSSGHFNVGMRWMMAKCAPADSCLN